MGPEELGVSALLPQAGFNIAQKRTCVFIPFSDDELPQGQTRRRRRPPSHLAQPCLRGATTAIAALTRAAVRDANMWYLHHALFVHQLIHVPWLPCASPANPHVLVVGWQDFHGAGAASALGVRMPKASTRLGILVPCAAPLARRRCWGGIVWRCAERAGRGLPTQRPPRAPRPLLEQAWVRVAREGLRRVLLRAIGAAIAALCADRLLLASALADAASFRVPARSCFHLF